MNGNFLSPGRLLATAVVLLGSLLVNQAISGPLHDPFLEKFQVGTWPTPADVQLATGYPAGLLEPSLLDTVWTDAAADVIACSNPTDGSCLTAKLLRGLFPAEAETLWCRKSLTALQDLIAGRPGSQTTGFLRLERLNRAFGKAIEGGQPGRAAELAETILVAADDLNLASRQLLVWELRHRLTLRMDHQPIAVSDSLWPGMTSLGPFDSRNAWALWAACRRDQGLSVVPRSGDRNNLADYLSRLPLGSLTAKELYESSLSEAWISALGSILLAKDKLPAHFKKFPYPPHGFLQQGLWLRGQRRLRRGLAGSYEQLAVRSGLSDGWRLDTWRRASELRLLRGAWVEGLADLRQALQLADQGQGTTSLRQRLRQWTEQALVLALAEDDLRTARELRDLGLARFHGQERAAFAAEISHWESRLNRGPQVQLELPPDSVDRARQQIAAGLAPQLKAAGDQEHSQFVAAADRSLWDVWRKWGLALANPLRVTGKKRIRAATYQKFLAAWPEAAAASSAADSVLMLVGMRLGDRPWAAELLRAVVDVDVGRRCSWQTPPRPSVVPDLLPKVRGSELDRHALLGFCLVIGDMRGILGLAYELPARGLTRAEKRLFLYPLPAAGAIRAAITGADSEPELLLAVARNESLFEPAVRSRAGALGWMQIMPFHYPQKGAVAGPGNWRVPAVSVERGDRLLTENRRRYHGDAYRAVAAYNAGPGAAGRWDKQLGGSASPDLYLAWIGYPETRAYVKKVLIDREVYRELIGAQSAPAVGTATGARTE